MLLLYAPHVEGQWVDSNFQIIDLLVPPRAAGVAGTLILFILQFATLQPWLHVGSFTCRILIHCIRTRDPYFYVPLCDTELFLAQGKSLPPVGIKLGTFGLLLPESATLATGPARHISDI